MRNEKIVNKEISNAYDSLNLSGCLYKAVEFRKGEDRNLKLKYLDAKTIVNLNIANEILYSYKEGNLNIDSIVNNMTYIKDLNDIIGDNLVSIAFDNIKYKIIESLKKLGFYFDILEILNLLNEDEINNGMCKLHDIVKAAGTSPNRIITVRLKDGEKVTPKNFDNIFLGGMILETNTEVVDNCYSGDVVQEVEDYFGVYSYKNSNIVNDVNLVELLEEMLENSVSDLESITSTISLHSHSFSTRKLIQGIIVSDAIDVILHENSYISNVYRFAFMENLRKRK